MIEDLPLLWSPTVRIFDRTWYSVWWLGSIVLNDKSDEPRDDYSKHRSQLVLSYANLLPTGQEYARGLPAAFSTDLFLELSFEVETGVGRCSLGDAEELALVLDTHVEQGAVERGLQRTIFFLVEVFVVLSHHNEGAVLLGVQDLGG